MDVRHRERGTRFWGNWSVQVRVQLPRIWDRTSGCGSTGTPDAPGRHDAVHRPTWIFDQIDSPRQVRGELSLWTRRARRPSRRRAPARATTGPALWVGAQGGYGFGYKRWPDFDPERPVRREGLARGRHAPAPARRPACSWSAPKANGCGPASGAAAGTRARTSAALTQTIDLASKVRLALAQQHARRLRRRRSLAGLRQGRLRARAARQHDFGVTPGCRPARQQSRFDLERKALHTGYLAGVGVEYAFLGNWSAKLEYNYIDFRLQNVMTTGVADIQYSAASVGDHRQLRPAGRHPRGHAPGEVRHQLSLHLARRTWSPRSTESRARELGC